MPTPLNVCNRMANTSEKATTFVTEPVLQNGIGPKRTGCFYKAYNPVPNKGKAGNPEKECFFTLIYASNAVQIRGQCISKQYLTQSPNPSAIKPPDSLDYREHPHTSMKSNPICFLRFSFLRFFVLLFFILSGTFSSVLPVLAQSAPKREFRAVWIATVANIDFPSRRDLSTDEQKEEFRRILDAHQRNGLNAVVVQIRPAADALYARSREPWSPWLTGQQGRPPQPFYDPLEFMLAECRQRCMEFHAWFNPYRATFDSASYLIPNHLTKTHPEWFLTYGGKKIFNPGLPPVREYVTQVIMDVVRNYDIDGVHFDDYFYPYTIANDTLRDDDAFAQHPSGFADKDDWRRNNISLLVKNLHDSLKALKPWVKFGVSPFGVWRNLAVDSLGSDTQSGQTTYDNLYADVRLWLREGWIDYVAPQIYFSTQHPKVNYAKLLDWWTKNSFGRHLYIGQGAYKIGRDRDSTWRDVHQNGNQLRLNRTYAQVQGSIFFSSKSLIGNALGVGDSLRNDFYRHPALIPVMDSGAAAPNAPAALKMKKKDKGMRLRWKATDPQTRYFAVYRFPLEQPVNVGDGRFLLATVAAQRKNGKLRRRTKYNDVQTPNPAPCRYAVTAVSRLHHESAALAGQTK